MKYVASANTYRKTSLQMKDMKTDNISPEYHYYAFISYNRTDEQWAKWLHKKIEYFHIPSEIRRKHLGIPKKIRPVFWYKQDLSGTVLKPKLNAALNESKYLIVICSLAKTEHTHPLRTA